MFEQLKVPQLGEDDNDSLRAVSENESFQAKDDVTQQISKLSCINVGLWEIGHGVTSRSAASTFVF